MDNKKNDQKKEEGKKMIQFVINTPMLANWVQIEITNLFFLNHASLSQ
jgi:hypothetical protein